MDKLARRLADDAGRIDATISPQLEQRIAASLAAEPPERPQRSAGRPRTASLWWASSLTGLAAALALIVIINVRQTEPLPPATPSPVAALELPAVPWRAKTAILTSPLQEEYIALQSDLEKAEQVVRDDLDNIF